jgi:hypothetical protein
VRVLATTIRSAAPLPLNAGLVDSCLRTDQLADCRFERAWRESLTSLTPEERRGALAGATGHIAESVAELMLDDCGYALLWHFEGPGRHGIDLLALDPSATRVVAFEVKGTLRPKHWPRLSRSALAQMSAAWVDKADNPGMRNWDLTSEDVYGGVILVNFAQRLYRVAFTSDFVNLQPVTMEKQIVDLSWLDEPERHGGSQRNRKLTPRVR